MVLITKSFIYLQLFSNSPCVTISNKFQKPHIQYHNFLWCASIPFTGVLAEYTVYVKDIHLLDAMVEDALYNQVQ